MSTDCSLSTKQHIIEIFVSLRYLLLLLPLRFQENSKGRIGKGIGYLLDLFVIGRDIPCGCDECIYGQVDWNDVCDDVRIAVQRAQYARADAGDHTCWPVQIVDPSDDWFAGARCHHGRPEHADW